MNDHETDLLLALLVEGKLDPAEESRVRELLARDPNLSATFADLVVLGSLEQTTSLSGLTDAEEAAAIKHMEQVLPSTGSEHSSEIHHDGSGPEGESGHTDENPVREPGQTDSHSSERGDPTMFHHPDRQDMHRAIDGLFGTAHQQPAADAIGQPGAPDLFSAGVHQGRADTCAIKCQQIILDQFGIDVSMDELTREAILQGWYAPGLGTSDGDVGKLLEVHGVSVQRYENANIFNLVSELAQGHRVILGVDSGEMWSSNPVLRDVACISPEYWEDGTADHAIIVSGIDVSDPCNPLVVVTDPGTGQVAATYPLPAFLEAWADSGFSMVTTASSPQQFAMEHIDSIGHLAYQDFANWYPSVSGLTGHEHFFPDACASFRHCVHQPVHDIQGTLLHHESSPGSTGLGADIGDHMASHLGLDPHTLLPDAHDSDDLDDLSGGGGRMT